MPYPTINEILSRGFIRDSLETTFDARVSPDDASVQQRRKIQMLVIHADIDTSDAISSYALTQMLSTIETDPVVFIENFYGSPITYTYTGQWDIEKQSMDDGGDGTTKWTITLRRTGDWETWEPSTF